MLQGLSQSELKAIGLYYNQGKTAAVSLSEASRAKLISKGLLSTQGGLTFSAISTLLTCKGYRTAIGAEN